MTSQETNTFPKLTCHSSVSGSGGACSAFVAWAFGLTGRVAAAVAFNAPEICLLNGTFLSAAGCKEAPRSPPELCRYWGFRVVGVRFWMGDGMEILRFLFLSAAKARASSEGKGGWGSCPVCWWPSMLKFLACSMADSNVPCRKLTVSVIGNTSYLCLHSKVLIIGSGYESLLPLLLPWSLQLLKSWQILHITIEAVPCVSPLIK